mgnify:CR=1 FL=1
MEMWKFSNQWTVEYAHSLFRLWLRARVMRTHIPHIYSGVGYFFVYIGKGLSTTSIEINGISSTLFF